jgi:glycosyltransferase involved in cell wall biosynthesis
MNGQLSIAFLSHAASTDAPTGAERSLALLAAGMRRRGHRVAVVIPGPWSLERELVGADVEIVRWPARACWLTYYAPRPWPVFVLKWARWAWPDRAVARIAAWIEDWGADVVHVNCLPHVRGAAAAFRAGRPVVWHMREILPPGPRRRWLAAKVSRYGTQVVSVSEAVAEWLRAESLGARTTVVPNGVALPGPSVDVTAARRELGLPLDGQYFGLFGQLVPHKGALDFVEAGRRTLESCADARFVIAGPGPERFRQEVRRAIAATGNPDRFRLLQAQPQSATLLAASDVVSLTTTTPDPFPRAVLEAMAAGRPVAAYRSGGTGEMVQDGTTGLLVETGDVQGLADAFTVLGRDADRRNEFGRAGARRARDLFSIEQHLDRMERLFRSVTP